MKRSDLAVICIIITGILGALLGAMLFGDAGAGATIASIACLGGFIVSEKES